MATRRSQPGHPPRRHPLRRLLTRLVALTLIVVVALVGAVAVLWPLTPGVGDASALVSARLARHQAPLLGALPVDDRVGQALIATEDSRFYDEPGVDPIGLVRALLGPLRGGGDQGGATLSQQLAKVLYTGGHTGLEADVTQVELAIKLNVALPKAEILRLYLAAVYFGQGFYGLPAAAEGYFGLPVAALGWPQASLLAGLVQAPSAYDPLLHLSLARQRQRHVLARLVATGVLSRAAAAAVYAAPLGLR